MTASAGAIKAGKAFVELAVDDLGLRAGLNRVSARLRSWASTTSKIGAALIGAGTAIAAPLVAMAASAASYGDSLNDASTRTGIAVGVLVELGYAAEQSGTSMETLEGAIKKMQLTIVKAGDGSKQAKAALAKLFLTVEDLVNLSPDEQFRLIADRISQIQDPALRTATAVGVLGKSATDLLPMMIGGGQGIAEMEKQADELGLTLAGKLASSVGDVDDLLGSLWRQIKAVKDSIGSAVADGIRPLLEASQPIIANFIKWIVANQSLVKTILLVGAGLAVVGGVLVTAGLSATILMTAFGGLLAVATAIGGAIVSAFALVASPIGIAVVAVGSLTAGILYMGGAVKPILSTLSGLFQRLKTTAIGAWQGIVAAIGAGDLSAAAAVAVAGLNLAWAEAMAVLKTAWAKVIEFMLSTASEAWARLQLGFESAVDSIATAWFVAINDIQAAWAKLYSNIKSIHENAIDYMEDRRLEVIAKREGLNLDDLKAQAQKDRQQRRGGMQEDYTAEEIKRQTTLVARLLELDRQRKQRETEIRQANEEYQKSLASGNAAEIAARVKDLEERRRELQDAIDRAKNAANPLSSPAKSATSSGGGMFGGLSTLMKLAMNSKAMQNSVSSLMAGAVTPGIMNSFDLQSQNQSPLYKKLEDYAERTAVATEDIALKIENLEPGLGVD